MTDETTVTVRTDPLVKIADAVGRQIKWMLNDTRSELGQFLTPPPVAQFMSGLISMKASHIRILDPGAGVGILTLALTEALLSHESRPGSIQATCFEIDPRLFRQLERNLQTCREHCAERGVSFGFDARREDFIRSATDSSRDLFRRGLPAFDCVILNPPYRKISSQSEARLQLRAAGIETSNLYSAFMLLAARQLVPGGEFVSITPRSFCNGPYFRQFRRQFLQLVALRRIHVFESRKTTFKDDDVLQENIILYGVAKAAKNADVEISVGSAAGASKTRFVSAGEVVRPDDPEGIIHIFTHAGAGEVAGRLRELTGSLHTLGISVSTGRVVDFRSRQQLRRGLGAGTVPLIYPAHLHAGGVLWPNGNSRKANAIAADCDTTDLLMPTGFYVLTRRFSAKEERRRVVAALYDPRLIASQRVGFDNKINVFHWHGAGMDERLARGLVAFLNSSAVDQYFRSFSGHTQVNAADLRRLPYPSLEQVYGLAEAVADLGDQATIDRCLSRLL